MLRPFFCRNNFVLFSGAYSIPSVSVPATALCKTNNFKKNHKKIKVENIFKKGCKKD